MTIEEFLKLKNPAMYDFKQECKMEGYHGAALDTHLKRFFYYKINHPKSFDADGSGDVGDFLNTLPREIYRELFSWDIKEGERYATINGFEGMLWGPDTMNTFMISTLPQFLLGTNILSDYKETYNSKQMRISKRMMYSIVVDNKLEISKYLGDDWESWEILCSLIHTLGNFALVPKGFNMTRAAQFDDFYDLSLQYLSVKAWATAGHFNWYINHFFLWDYVHKIKNTYCAKSLFNPDFLKGEVQRRYFNGQIRYPKHTKDEIKVWIWNTTIAIKRRGKLMAALLKLKKQDSDSFEILKKKYFDSNEAIGSLESVVNHICEEIKDKAIAEEIKNSLA